MRQEKQEPHTKDVGNNKKEEEPVKEYIEDKDDGEKGKGQWNEKTKENEKGNEKNKKKGKAKKIRLRKAREELPGAHEPLKGV